MTEKNVLITGASRGIGRSTALLFADKGFHVFLNCHKSIEELQKVQQEIEQNHPNCSTIVTGNVGNSEDVHSIFREIYSHCDSLDVLVNNAGVAHIGLLMDLTDEEWRRIIDTNLSSVFYCCREAVPKMVSTKSGRIIHVGNRRRVLRSCLFRFQIRYPRSHPRPCKRTCSQWHPCQCHCLRRYRYSNERTA